MWARGRRGVVGGTCRARSRRGVVGGPAGLGVGGEWWGDLQG